MENLPAKGSDVEISYCCGDRMVNAEGRVVEIDDERIVLDIDGCDNSMTPEPGDDLYLMKGGGLYNVLESKNFPRIVAEKVYERRHARVNDVLRVGYRIVDPDRYLESGSDPRVILDEVFGGTPFVPEVENVTAAMLYQLLYQLNQKVDRILDIVDLDHRRHITVVPMEWVNISAAGLRLNLREKIEPGTIVALQIELPLETCTRLQVLGKVLSSDPTEEENTFRTAVQFLDLSEDVEDLLTRYVFKRQRELLRGESGDQGARTR